MTRAAHFRVATFNVQAGIGTTRGYWHYLLTAWKYRFSHGSEPIRQAGALLASERVDLAALCEIEGASRRTRGVDQAALLSGAAGLPERAFFPAYVAGERINQGNALCTRFAVRYVENHLLPGDGEPRYLGEAVVAVGGAEVRVFVTHLSLQRRLRTPQIERIADAIGPCDEPTILAGDFNVSEEDELELLVGSVLQKSLSVETFPSWRPVRALDHLLFSRHFTITRSYTVAAPRVSDHLPLIAEVTLEEG